MKRLFQFILAFICVSLLSACGGGGGSPGKTSNAALFTSAGAALTIAPGQTQVFTVGGGTPSYLVSANSAAVTATISGTTLTITGSLGGGAATVVVTDQVGAKVTIAVTVGTGFALYTSAPTDVSVAAGAILPATPPYFQIGGGSGVYAVSSSNNDVAYVGINGNQFMIGGVSAGKATVKVTDSLGALVTINVTVTASNASLFSTAPAATNLPVTKSVTYLIAGGTAPYTVVSDSIGIATVAQSGNNFTITGISAGTANIYISDAVGAQIKVTVTVAVPTVSPLTISPNVASGNVGDTLNFVVTGGVGPYTVSNSNNTIATVTTTSTDGSAFSAVLNNVGTTQVTVVDQQKNTVTISVTAVPTSPTLRLSPNALTVSELYGGAISLNIYGGTPPYTGFTSDSTMGTVTTSTTSASSAAQGIFTVNGVANKASGVSGRCFTPPTALSAYNVTLTVIDSKGASATSTLSIQDTLDTTCK